MHENFEWCAYVVDYAKSILAALKSTGILQEGEDENISQQELMEEDKKGRENQEYDSTSQSQTPLLYIRHLVSMMNLIMLLYLCLPMIRIQDIIYVWFAIVFGSKFLLQPWY